MESADRESERAKVRIINILRKVDDVGVVEALSQLMGDESSSVRLQAMHALLDMDSPKLPGIFAGSVYDAHHDVRWAAIEVLLLCDYLLCAPR